MNERIAIIDLGTNTFHLLIAEKEGRQAKILYREKQAVKIGMGGINAGVITGAAMDRALACLQTFKKTIHTWHAGDVFAFGTSALRSAGNRDFILKRILDETGIEVRLISGDEEADYIYYGVRSAVDLGPENSVIMDIGGGSVEFIIGNKEIILWKKSFDIGAQRLLERFQKHDPILTEEIVSLENCFETELQPLRLALKQFPTKSLVGSSGTFDTLSEIYCIRHHLALSDTQRETPLTREAFFEIHKEIISSNRADRLKIPGMIEMRVDMIVVAGCLIHFVLNTFQLKSIKVSTYSLKEGVLSKMSGRA